MGLDFSRNEPKYAFDDSAIGYYFCRGICYLGYDLGLVGAEKAEEREYVLSLEVKKEGVNNKIKSFDKDLYLWDGDVWYKFKIDSKILAHEENARLLADYCEKILKEILKGNCFIK